MHLISPDEYTGDGEYPVYEQGRPLRKALNELYERIEREQSSPIPFSLMYLNLRI